MRFTVVIPAVKIPLIFSVLLLQILLSLAKCMDVSNQPSLLFRYCKIQYVTMDWKGCENQFPAVRVNEDS